MRSVTQIVDQLLAHTPYLEEALAAGLLNLSALARRLQPAVEATLGKRVTRAAVLMALRRRSGRLPELRHGVGAVLRGIREVAVRGELVEFTLPARTFGAAARTRLLEVVSARSPAFLAVTQGIGETTVIVDATAAETLARELGELPSVGRIEGLSALTVRLPEQAVQVPGVHYTLLKQLAWVGVNVVEVISTFTELTIVLAEADVERAFAALQGLLRAARRREAPAAPVT